MKKPSVPLKDIVKAKYVVCLECGKKMRTLKTHMRKAHGLLPKEYYPEIWPRPEEIPLVCKEYSEQRSKMAKDRGFGVKGDASEGELSKRSNSLPLNQTEKSKNRRRKLWETKARRTKLRRKPKSRRKTSRRATKKTSPAISSGPSPGEPPC